MTDEENLGKPLEFLIRFMEPDVSTSGEDPVEGGWEYVSVGNIISALQKYAQQTSFWSSDDKQSFRVIEHPDHIKITNPSATSGPHIPQFYFLVGRKPDELDDYKVGDFELVKTVDGNKAIDGMFLAYASLGLMTPDEKVVMQDDKLSDTMARVLAVSVLKCVTEHYIGRGVIPNDYFKNMNPYKELFDAAVTTKKQKIKFFIF